MGRAVSRGADFWLAEACCAARRPLGRQREEAGYDTQDDAIERLTQI